MRARFAVYLLTLALSFTTFPAVSWAQGTGDRSAVPEPAALLPELIDEQSSAQVINSATAAKYRTLLPAELIPLFKDGQLEVEAARSFKNAPQLSEAWAKGNRATLAGVKGELRPGAEFGKGLLFPPSDLSTEGNKRALAYKSLWNSVAVWGAQPLLRAAFDFSWFKEGKPFRSLRGEFSRVIPNSLPEAKQTAQVFRELIRFTTPLFLQDLSWLTFRFLGSDDDILWVYSPAIRKVRQLTSTNRSDPILRSAVSPEEFLVWSGKPEAVDAVVEGAAPLLVPVLRAHVPARRRDGDCATVDRASAVAGQMGARWNYETSRFPHGAGWVPSSTIFIPRPVLKIALDPLDPYSSYGRQIVYIDRDLALPVYKFVYSRTGQLWKTVIGTYGMAEISSDLGQMPYPAYTIVVDHSKSEVYVLDFAGVELCTIPVQGLALGDFDPKRFSELGKNAAPQPQPPALPAAQSSEPVDEL